MWFRQIRKNRITTGGPLLKEKLYSIKILVNESTLTCFSSNKMSLLNLFKCPANLINSLPGIELERLNVIILCPA